MKPTVVSFFSGALGLDIGLEQAGFELAAAVECDPTQQGSPVVRLEGVRTKDVPDAATLAMASCGAAVTLRTRGVFNVLVSQRSPGRGTTGTRLVKPPPQPDALNNLKLSPAANGVAPMFVRT